MTHRVLTDVEKAHLEGGGRVFLVSDLKEVVIISADKVYILSNNDGQPIRYASGELALQTAQMIASLSEDVPLVEGKPIDWK